MKRRLYHLLFLSAFVLAGCSDQIENDLNLIERRLNEIQKTCDQLNRDITSLGLVAKSLENYDFVSGVKVDRSGERTVYTIKMSKSEPIVIWDGVDAESPMIGIKMNSDGKYYWTMTYPGKETQFIRADDGTLVATTASSPQFRIRDGKWEVSYNEGRTWTNNYKGMPFGNATGESPRSFFDSVVDSVDYFIFKMKDASTILVPSWLAYEKIEETVRTANENYKATQAIIDALREEVFITGVTPILDSGNDTLGYRMNLSSGTGLTFYNGVATNRPEIGVSRDPENPSDTAYYWTVKQAGAASYTWLLFLGVKVRADAGDLFPQIAVKKKEDGLYYWNISFNGGPWTEVCDTLGNAVRASVKEPAVMDSIGVTKDYVHIRQAGMEYRIQRYRDFVVTGVPDSLEVAPGDTSCFDVVLDAGRDADYSGYEILPVASDSLSAKGSPMTQDRKEWTVSVTASAGFSTSGNVSLIVSDGKGLLKTCTIEVICKK